MNEGELYSDDKNDKYAEFHGYRCSVMTGVTAEFFKNNSTNIIILFSFCARACGALYMTVHALYKPHMHDIVLTHSEYSLAEAAIIYRQ